MIDRGDILVADVGGETREYVLVLSGTRFQRTTGRLVVAPEYRGRVVQPAPPWHVAAGGRTYALDGLLTIRGSDALEAAGRATAEEWQRAHRTFERVAR